MSLKLVELQVAIPKTVDAGKIADHQQQQSMVNQSHLAAIAEKERLRKLETVNHFEKSEKAKEKREREKGTKDHTENNMSAELQQSALPEERHPFKGRRVDFSG
ncbi:RNA polymerase subunit sigma [Jeotgalibacillus sp. JSM ZJ347]|uniref:RNA polymerase subunit sigma n=1 Tax=Jeotgalibacillus sp. JSM ZJ347 TaxID=3342117 RepID=UPI0035A84024